MKKKPMNTTAELLSVIWECVDLLNNADMHDDAKWIEKTTKQICKEIQIQEDEKATINNN